ncbi:MAG: sulfite exporter TauE/SafE family protein [Bacteroidia bacterium]|nr:sulfite exporter TauE/SafE family protein [Bacteroidia bacterium]MDW8088636.1 sulfite exporter TauE/SafE family protein [Bacteroidia bacterium]
MHELLVGIGLGMLAGLLSGMIGIGGGTIIIPLLVLLLGYSQHLAQGTALLAFAFPVFGWAAWNYYRYGRVEWRLALGIATGLGIASFFVAAWIQSWSTVLLRRVFAFFLIAVSMWQFWQAGRRIQKAHPVVRSIWQRLLLGVFVGLLAGALKGLTGLGGGVIIVPLLVALAGLDQHTAQGTSLLTMTLPVSFMAVIPYWRSGNVAVGVSLALGVGIFLGSALSSRLAQRVAGVHLARLFATVLMVIGVVLFLR